MDNNQTIVILGGGVGGVVSAVELRKKLPKQHRIVLVDREEQHLFAPSLLWLMIGQRTAEKISRPLDRLRKKGIDVVRRPTLTCSPMCHRTARLGSWKRPGWSGTAVGSPWTVTRWRRNFQAYMR